MSWLPELPRLWVLLGVLKEGQGRARQALGAPGREDGGRQKQGRSLNGAQGARLVSPQEQSLCLATYGSPRLAAWPGRWSWGGLAAWAWSGAAGTAADLTHPPDTPSGQPLAPASTASWMSGHCCFDLWRAAQSSQPGGEGASGCGVGVFERRCDGVVSPRLLRRRSLPGPLESPGRVGRLHRSFFAFGVRGSRWWWQRWPSGACWGQREKESRLNPQTRWFGLRFLLVFWAHREARPTQEPGWERLGWKHCNPPPPPPQSLSPHLGSQSLGKKVPHCVPSQTMFRAKIRDKNYQLWLTGLSGRLSTAI